MRRALSRAVASFALWLVPVTAGAAVYPCDEPGVLAALAAGGGPHTFACSGPTTIVTSAELLIAQSVELDGGGLLTLSGGGTHRVISTTSGPVTLRNLTLRDGYVPPAEFGACISSGAVTLENVEVTGCRHDGFGGAVYGGPLTLVDSDIHGNHTTGITGGCCDLVITRTRIRNNTGGGLRSDSPTFITESTISGNTAPVDAGILIGGSYLDSMVMSRSTVSHNVAASAAGSGGLGVWSGADIDDSTFVGNLPVAVRAYQSYLGGQNVRIRSSTLIGNPGRSTLVVDPPDPFMDFPVSATIENTILAGGGGGRIHAFGMNVVVHPEGCAGGPTTGPVLCATQATINLGKLGPHGGPTWTVPLRSPSIAIDAAAACTSATDQRGVARPQGAACDAGAFEADFAEPVPALPAIVVVALAAVFVASGALLHRRARGAVPLAALVLALASRADAAVFSCDEPGVLAAIAAGGGPHTFSCGGPTTIVTSAELVISQPVALDGGGLLTLSGGDAHRVMTVDAVTTLRNLALVDGLAQEPGIGEIGGCVLSMANLTLENVEIARCEAYQGGGIASVSTALLTVTDSIIHGGHAGWTGGGIVGGPLVITRTSIRGNRAEGNGGGIATGRSVITDSTITGNVAEFGGGISYGNTSGFGSLTLSRSTVSHNFATNSGGGLGVVGDFVGIDDSTFVGNQPDAIYDSQWGPEITLNNVKIRNSTVIGNSGAAPSSIVVGPAPPPLPHYKEVYARVENTILVGRSAGYISSGGGNVYGTAAALNLGKLGPHGGPTWTVPLRAPSAAIDAAPGCLTATDQRGVARPQGAACDVGAFEYDGPAPGQVPALPPEGIALLAAALLALARKRRA